MCRMIGPPTYAEFVFHAEHTELPAASSWEEPQALPGRNLVELAAWLRARVSVFNNWPATAGILEEGICATGR